MSMIGISITSGRDCACLAVSPRVRKSWVNEKGGNLGPRLRENSRKSIYVNVARAGMQFHQHPSVTYFALNVIARHGALHCHRMVHF